MGIGVIVNYRAIHKLDYYKKELGYQRGDFSVSESISDTVISLPFIPYMTHEQAMQVINCVAVSVGN
jgi:dTDP-4-amino-4,6-dideoxygalactose transaminase